jgi:2-methylisocitrate lyase-like PEP mutase family enzyme
MSRPPTPTHRQPEADCQAQRLRELLEAPRILEIPTVCDPLGARAAADSGYQAVTLAGYAIGAHLPSGSALSLAYVESTVRRVFRACGVPVLLDADAGWGDGADLTTAIGRLARAGAAGIQLSSQHLPSAVPFDRRFERRRSHHDLVKRVGEAADSMALIAARCDIDIDDGHEVALERAAELIAAGAGALLVHSADDAILRYFADALPDARLIYAANPALPCLPSVYPAEKLELWGYSAVNNKYHRCYCTRTNPTVTWALREPHAASRN